MTTKQTLGAWWLLLSLALVGCDNGFKFSQVKMACEPPLSSARFGKNTGPIVTSPEAFMPFNSSALIKGTCVAGLSVTLSGSGLEEPLHTECQNGEFSADIKFTSGDGVKEIDVAQKTLGETNITDRLCLSQDSTPPDVNIAGSEGEQSMATRHIDIEGTCESGLDVVVSGPHLLNSVTTACDRGHFVTPIEFTGEDGLKNVEAHQIDLAGNDGRDDRDYMTDTGVPVVVITSPDALSVSKGLITLQGDCETGLPVVLQGALQSTVSKTDCAEGRFSSALVMSNGDGLKNISVAQTDRAGNTGRDQRDFMKDSTTPMIKILNPAAGLITKAGLRLSGQCETDLLVELSGPGLAIPQQKNCDNGEFAIEITLAEPDGEKVVIATQVDVAGNIGSDKRVFVRDNTPPVLTIDNPAENSIWANGLTLAGQCETGLPVKISGAGVNADSTTSCTAGHYSTALTFSSGDGVKNVVATQIDVVGNSVTLNRSFMRDSVSPVISILSPADRAYVGASIVLSGSCEPGLPVTITGAGVATAAVADCFDGQFSEIVDLTLPDGEKVVRASQTDLAGNTGSDVRTYIKDTMGPIVKITSPAANSVWRASLVLKGNCETGLDVVITGDAATTIALCANNVFAARIELSDGEGVKRLTASQTDKAGFTGQDARDFLRRNTAPLVFITTPADNSYVTGTATIGGTCETGINVVLNGPGVSGSMTVPCQLDVFSSAVTFTAGDGLKEVVASQTDPTGNMGSDRKSYVRDSTAPLVKITSPGMGAIVQTSVTLTGTCEVGLPVVVWGAGVAVNVTTICSGTSGGSFSTPVALSADDGKKLVNASQTDAAGHSATDSRTFIKDNGAPLVKITAPAENTFLGNEATISGTCEAGLDVILSSTSATTTPLTTACSTTGGFAKKMQFVPSGDSITVAATQMDLAGNTGRDSRRFFHDSSAPLVQILSPEANQVFNSTLTLQGRCETGLPVSLTGDIDAVSAACTASTFSTVIRLSTGEGAKRVVASQTDANSNSGSDSRSFIRDSLAPKVEIQTPAPGVLKKIKVTLAGACETGLIVLLNGTGLASEAKVACTDGQFSLKTMLTTGDGAKVVLASQVDAAGNIGSDKNVYTLDTSTPANNRGHETFISQGPGGKVDILFVDDNSSSMEEEQKELGHRFSSFSKELTDLDWQAGVITTDCENRSWYNLCGQLLNLADKSANGKILSEKKRNYLKLFKATIQRQETPNCWHPSSDHPCPSGAEEGLKSTIESFKRRDSANKGFFRESSDLAVVYLSDEDEQSTRPDTATKPNEVINAFKNTWGNTKKLSAYAIIIKPGDAACLRTQKRQPAAALSAAYGTAQNELATMTAGMSMSICETDYSETLEQIGRDVTRLSRSFDLPQTPILNSVRVIFTPQFRTTFTVNGNRVTLEQVPPQGTKVEISYEY